MTTTDIADRLGPSFDLFEGMAKARPRPRRAWARAGGALALAVACGAGFVGLYASAGARHPVLAIARAVPAGATITAGDLRVVRLSSDPGVTALPATEASAVIGRAAAVSLVPGGLLVGADLASGPVVPAGWASVGLDLKADQAPANLIPGSSVMVVVTTPPGQANSSGAPPQVLTVAKVIEIAPPNPNSTDTVLTLAVPGEAAAVLAQASSAGTATLVGLGPGGRQ